ncbi:hypothetical protein NT6N_17000 [Oceaniferula spumae]|uniref:Tetratricopeptide repeat protein n=1 Tax=Oceaniferula spumae TaxID=2979115 RepID=A0AAT9FL18_9BACT
MKFRVSPVTSFALSSIACIAIAGACLWDRDTIIDELQTKASQYDLVMGQFPSHGDVYYQSRISKLEAKPSLTKDEKNDLAVAYTRTKQFAKGLTQLKEILKDHPGDYASLSNMGVTYKKMGDYQKAATFMEKALKIKPEGHMGLGDWYLKRLQWSAKYELSGQPIPSVNFLGEDYSKIELRYFRKHKVTNERKSRATLLTKMIKNDRHFSDSYVVMGDLLLENADLNLALRCYLHALHLEHPNKTILSQRIGAILSHWKTAPYKPTTADATLSKAATEQNAMFLNELKQTEQWLADFHAAEASLVSKGKQPTFDETSAVLKTKRFRPKAPSNGSKIKTRR